MEPVSAQSPTQATSKKQEPAKHPLPADPEPARFPGAMHQQQTHGRAGAAGKGVRFPGAGARPHLPLAELQHLGQALPLRRGEVFLRLELLLQLDGLVVGEADLPPLPLVQRPLDEGAPQQRLPYKERHSAEGHWPAADTRDWGALALPRPRPGSAPGPGLANFLCLILFPPVPTLIFPLSDFSPPPSRETS